MEKIYMEDNNNQQQRFSGLDVSVVLSFVVAIFAVFSLATYGVVSLQGTGVSYAAPITVTGDEFNFYLGDSNARVDGKNDDSTTSFVVPLYYSDADRTKPIFCVEHAARVTNSDAGVPYSKNGVIEDYGLLYILNNSFVNENNIANGNSYVEAWATQAAIWLYLNEKYPSDSKHTLSAEEKQGIENATVFYYTGGHVEATGVYAKIRTLVDAAKTVSGAKNLTVTKANGEISKTDDGKFYQSTKITVAGNPSSDLKSYDVSLSGIDGAIAVDESGNTISNNVSGNSFYVRIPVEKVTENVQTVTVNVTGHFDILTGSYYTAKDGSDLQKVVSVTGSTKNVSDGTSIEFVGAPDTGMNTAQTIYFIGLIVLLCGVGIVYANAKPIESKQ